MVVVLAIYVCHLKLIFTYVFVFTGKEQPLLIEDIIEEEKREQMKQQKSVVMSPMEGKKEKSSDVGLL